MDKNKDTNKIEDKRQLGKCVGEAFNPGEFYLHPITLQLRKNVDSEPACASELIYDKEKNKFYDLIKAKNQNIPNKIEIRKFMALPYVGFSSGQILKLYDIYSLSELIEWIKKQIKNKENFEYVNRIIKIYIHNNINQYKNNFKILAKSELFKIVLKNYKKKKYMNNEKINKYIEEYVEYWFTYKKLDSFDLDLITDLSSYLKKKLKLKN